MRQYSSYKRTGVTWIAEIPTEWKIARLKTCVNPITERAENNNGYIGLENIESWTGKYTSKKKNEAFEAEGNSISIHKGNVLFGKLRPYLAKCYVADAEGCCSTEFIVMDPKSIDSTYLKYMILSPAFIDNINMSTYGSKMPRANWDFMGNMVIPVPSTEDQQGIVSYLNNKMGQIDAIIAEAKASIEEYKQWKASIIYEAVTKGLDPDTEVVDSGIDWIGMMPKTWTRTKISRCFNVIGSGTTPRSDNDSFYVGDINWLQSGDINGGIVVETKKHISQDALDQFSALKIYDAPFIAVAMYGASIANTSIVTINACTNQACCVLSSVADFVVLEYTFYALLAAKQELLLCGRGGTQPNISQDIIRNLVIPIPPRSEQEAIKDYLEKQISTINGLIAEKEALVTDLDAYKKSLIFEVVTGKRKVV